MMIVTLMRIRMIGRTSISPRSMTGTWPSAIYLLSNLISKISATSDGARWLLGSLPRFAILQFQALAGPRRPWRDHTFRKILRHLFIFHLFIFHLFIFNHKYKFILMQLKNKKTMWSQWSAWLTQPWIKELILRKWTRLCGTAVDGNKKLD